MTTSAAFWDRAARGYAEKPIKDPDAYAQTLERMRAYLTAEDHVLELGCGTGTTAIALAPDVASIDAADISPTMVAIGRAKATNAPNLAFHTATPDAAPSREGGYDVVTAFHLLHLLEDLDGALAAIRRRLRPGGLFISKTICLGRSASVYRVAIPALRLFGKAPYVRFLDVDGLDARIRDAGFDILETGAYPAKPPARFVVARRREDAAAGGRRVNSSIDARWLARFDPAIWPIAC